MVSSSEMHPDDLKMLLVSTAPRQPRGGMTHAKGDVKMQQTLKQATQGASDPDEWRMWLANQNQPQEDASERGKAHSKAQSKAKVKGHSQIIQMRLASERPASLNPPAKP